MNNNDDKKNQQFLPVGELMKKDLPEIRWLVDGLIPEESIILLAARPGLLKTWLALQMAIDIASGKDFLDKFNTTQAPVLILDGESGERLLKNRLSVLGVDNTDELPIYYQTYPGGKKFDKNFFETVMAFCLDRDIKLVIIDSLVRFIDAKDENSAVDIACAFKYFARLKMLGISTLLIHHNRKNSGKDGPDNLESVRGSGDIVASSDMAILLLNRNKDSITIAPDRNRYDEEGPSFRVRFKKDSEQRSVWHYVGKVTKVDSNELTINAIMEILADFGEINQKDLITAVKERGLVVGEKKICSILGNLVIDGKIGCKSGNRTEKIYYLKGETQNG